MTDMYPDPSERGDHYPGHHSTLSPESVESAATVVLNALSSPQGLITVTRGDGTSECTIFELNPPNGLPVCRTLRIPRDTKWDPLLDGSLTGANNSPHELPELQTVPRSLVLPLNSRSRQRGFVVVAGRDHDYHAADKQKLAKFSRLLVPLTEPLPELPAIQTNGHGTPHGFALQNNILELSLASSLSNDELDQLPRESLINLYRESQAEVIALQQSFQQLSQHQPEPDVDYATFRRQHEAILNNSPACIYVKNADGRYEFINRTFEVLFDIKLQDIVGKNDYELFPKEAADQFRKNDELVAQTGQIVQTEEYVPQKGNLHTYLSVKFPILDLNGNVRSIGGISTDVTDHVRTKHQAERLSQRLSSILDSVADGVIGLDRDGKLTFMNAAAELMTEWTEEELIGKSIGAILGGGPIPGGHLPKVAAPIFAALEDGSTFLSDGEVFHTKGGNTIPVSYVCTPTREKGETSGVVISFCDITQDLEIEEARRQSAEARAKIGAIETIQKDLFARSSHLLKGFDIHASIWAANLVSGDFYDFALGNDGKLLITVGDACGHDLAAAVRMVETRALLHAYLDFNLPLDELLRRISNKLIDDPKGRFVSVTMAHIDPVARELDFLGAGHDAVIVRRSGEVVTLSSTGVPLGVLLNAQVDVHRVKIEPGDVMVFATDGVTEAGATKKYQFGRKRLIDIIQDNLDRSSHEITEAIYNAIDRFSKGAHIDDDVTILVVRALADE